MSIVYAEGVDPIIWEPNMPELRAPILVCSFRGWNDAAVAASTALETITESHIGELIAQIDPEEFFDFQANRPTVVMTEGQTREIEWPENNLIAVRIAEAERDLVLLDGTEPNLRWRTFSESITAAAQQLGVEMVITLGALIAEVSHTLPVPITGLASDEDLVERLDLQRSNYEGPTGITGVLHDSCGAAGIPSASLWAAVPHYVAAVPSPKAALALLRRLEGLTGFVFAADELEDEARNYDDQVGRAIAANPEVEEMVERIEAEQTELIEDGEVPNGESLAQEFQRFLSQRGDQKD